MYFYVLHMHIQSYTERQQTTEGNNRQPSMNVQLNCVLGSHGQESADVDVVIERYVLR